MATSNSFPARARFDQFHVDLRSGVLQRSGVRVPVQGQPLQVLRLLLEAGGKVVTREELRKVLWPEDTFVDFELGVNTAVKKLRQALTDRPRAPSSSKPCPELVTGSSFRWNGCTEMVKKVWRKDQGVPPVQAESELLMSQSGVRPRQSDLLHQVPGSQTREIQREIQRAAGG